MSGAPVRLAAGELLHITLDRRRTLDEAMTASAAFSALEGSDRGFARAIASQALRALGWIDRALAPLLSRPFEAVSPEVRALLRAGAAQVWLMDIPVHAAVGETVEAARQWAPARRGGAFLNAALRRVSETPLEHEALDACEVWPDWLRERMIASLGPESARALAAAQLEPPLLHLTARGDPAAVAAMTGGEVRPSGSIGLSASDPAALPGFAEGAWWVQDEAAALPARLLGAGPGERVLDLCAAPGGKTLQLAATGAEVTALDRSAPRLERLRENLQRTGLAAHIVTAEAETWQAPQPFDAILLDAPCSALGTLRRHPEGAWIKSGASIAPLPDVQRRLLETARRFLKPEGRLVYTVCSPLAEEGPHIVAQALASGAWQIEPVSAAEAGYFAPALTPEGAVLTVPRAGEAHDAFYMARLRPAG